MITQFDIIGTEMGCRGRLCKAHPICGDQVQEGTMVWLRLMQLCLEGLDEVAIVAVCLDNEGNDRCRVGVTPRHLNLIHHYCGYDDTLARVIKVYSRLPL